MTQVRNPIRATVTGASSVVLAEDAARLDPILVQNLSEETVYLDFGQPAEVADGWPLPGGDVLRFTSTLAINAITAGAAASLAILVGADTQESGQGAAPAGSASDPMHVELDGSVPLSVNVASLPMGTPAGTALDPVHVAAAGPAGNAADPVHTTETAVTMGDKAGGKPAEITGAAASVLALAANPARTHAIVKCIPGAAATCVWLGLGAAAEANKGLRLDPGDSLQLDADWMYLGAINFYGAATATVAVWEA